MTIGRGPLVSVVIPVHNGANFLAKAIDSARNQTYENIEIIVVNDGSSDNGATNAIIESYIPQIRSFNKLNGGVASALNLGIREASGSFVSWLSHDDEYLPRKIQSQIDMLTTRGMKSVVYSGYRLVNSKSKTIETIDPAALMTPRQLEDPLYPLMRRLIHGCSLLIPREAFLEIGMFDESLVHTQDYALWFEIFRAYGLVYDPNILTLSRRHKNQSSKTIPGQVAESDALWVGILRKLTVDEMTRMSGSAFEFYREMSRLLSLTPYRKAYAYASLSEATAWKRLVDEDPTAAFPKQFRSPNPGSNLSPLSHIISAHMVKSFVHVLRRKGMKETTRLILIQINQYIKRRSLKRE